MRKYTVLAISVLSCAAFCFADSVTITRGNGILVGTGFPGATYSFGFSGTGRTITVPAPLSDFDGGRGLVDCAPCDPLTTNIELLFSAGITGIGGNRFVEGLIEYDPVSFTSSLRNGLLEVDYRATADIELMHCVGDPVECFPGGPTFVSNPRQIWYVRALFTPNNGQYIFQSARFSSSPLAPVPEPATPDSLVTSMNRLPLSFL